jgi:hypothetical protein
MRVSILAVNFLVLGNPPFYLAETKTLMLFVLFSSDKSWNRCPQISAAAADDDDAAATDLQLHAPFTSRDMQTSHALQSLPASFSR